MKSLALILIICSFNSIGVNAQDTTYFYYGAGMGQTTRQTAIYIREEIKLEEDKGYIIRLISNSTGLIYEGEFSSISPDIEHGEVKHYSNNGTLVEIGYFNNGYPDSLWRVYNPQTQRVDTIEYSKIKGLIEDGALGTTYPMVYDHVGKFPSFPDLEDPSLKKNYKDFNDYIAKEHYFPVMGRRMGMSGLVHLTFTIGPEGDLHDIQTATDQSPYLYFEAVRILANSPRWIPGEDRGRKVPVSMQQTITFGQ
ncbi:MAG: energy transducer TonB [Bacteroidales bacterium]|nr:energy transducer TonB [Bacteroidales bacterium]